MTDLTIIIVHYNTPDWLHRCLSSLAEYVIKPSRYQIHVNVIDNGSTPANRAAAQKACQKWPHVTYEALPKNVGFAGGNNFALRRAKSEYVMLLNSDTEMTEHSHLDVLLDYLEAHPDVAVITPKVVLGNGHLDWASHRGEPTPWAGFTYILGFEKIFPYSRLFGQYHQRYAALKEIHEIDACSGAAMIVRSQAMREVGYLDERFFMYAEDVDWCKRFRDAGYQVIFHPGAQVVHHKYKSGRAATDKVHAKQISHHFYETMIQYFDKHYRHQYPKLVRWMLLIFITLKKGVV